MAAEPKPAPEPEPESAAERPDNAVEQAADEAEIAGGHAVAGAEAGSSGSGQGAAETEASAAVPDETGALPPEAPADDLVPVGDEPPLADDDVFDAALEAVLLVVDAPIDDGALAGALDQPVKRVREGLRRLADGYTARRAGIDLRRSGEGWRFYTRDVYAPYVEKLLLDGQRTKLTRAALETLAVIAYRQPVTRSRVAAVRGVNVDGVMRTLVVRGLVEETGTDPETGGHLYRTTELFLERLGLSSLADLPPIAPLLPEVDAIDDVV
ncbi:SMC-Scp complex subunit ScpB [Actinokineospora sp. UTMC 2448]|uniref:SMC-Scp complex subunit ScpB n=1 Tax=Actinokineospora sp. UTMC 2448 TaxID=2268449 RepID=UPI0021645D26|nr:SMC-Scp complex subunit ScpB [Actinokineospora sp. UTMC 2448]